jgi:xanthine/CO dehydrogenase XdhC/CoxF family maturation factor
MRRSGCLRTRQRGRPARAPRAASLRDIRQRRIRRRPHLRRNDRRLHRAVVPQHVSPTTGDRRRHRCASPDRRRHSHRPSGPRLARAQAGRRDAHRRRVTGIHARQDVGMEVFVASHAPRPRMLVFGAIDFASALSSKGRCWDIGSPCATPGPSLRPRPAFPTPTTSSSIGLIATSPHRRSRVRSTPGPRCVLTHDPKFDVPVLRVALRLPEVDYIGVMGSRRGDHRPPLRWRRPAVDRGRRPHPPRLIR